MRVGSHKNHFVLYEVHVAAEVHFFINILVNN